MDLLRTPDDRFLDLPDYPFEPHYAEVTTPDGPDSPPLRVHYVDEGPADGKPIWLLHGEPSWSFLYRHMIPVLVDAGYRCIVPDQVGFGRSDKPTNPSDYTYARHVEWMRQLLCERLDVTDCVFFGQDWGGLVGLRVVAENPDRFSHIIVANTGLPTGEGMPEAFENWRLFAETTPVFSIGRIINGATVIDLADDVLAAYDAPFPDESYKVGARIWPGLVPVEPDDPAVPDNLAAWRVLERWTKPLLTAFSDQDPITGGGQRRFQRTVPGAGGQPHVTIKGGGHFLQEDKGPELAGVIVDFLNSTT